MYEFKFLNLPGFISIFDNDFDFDKFVDDKKQKLLQGFKDQDTYLQQYAALVSLVAITFVVLIIAAVVFALKKELRETIKKKAT